MSSNNEQPWLSTTANDPRTEAQMRADYHRTITALKEPRPTPVNYDQKCYDLAEIFLTEEVSQPNYKKSADELAKCIQEAIEDWLMLRVA